MFDDLVRYEFADNVVEAFFYDSTAKVIELYYDYIYEDETIEKPCKLVIRNWKDARSKQYGIGVYKSLEAHLGIIDMILNVEVQGNRVEMFVTMLGGRDIILVFTSPEVKLDFENLKR
ncbi:hypothetical protein O4H49_14320 [Kiloniella laminariae]|uniref:Uncharacterized protein n=1 Tax=Kiloniella laminariae TaxID=454162 RepID=A0ABT4LLH7_9PROT|nr:hypothetical protein [Kiloniella laminariae]MCZ4281963.1 hypothetical protein [Kiloniella laminariae]